MSFTPKIETSPGPGRSEQRNDSAGQWVNSIELSDDSGGWQDSIELPEYTQPTAPMEKQEKDLSRFEEA